MKRGEIGWGGRTRTCEWQNQNLLTYQLVDTPKEEMIIFYMLKSRLGQGVHK